MPGTADKPLMIHGVHALPLRGWDRYSVWGLDQSEATYGLYAQLWRNGDDPNENPRRWLMGYKDVMDLGYAIVKATRSDETAVAKAILVGLDQLAAEQGID
jgi:hypothetical protein